MGSLSHIPNGRGQTCVLDTEVAVVWLQRVSCHVVWRCHRPCDTNCMQPSDLGGPGFHWKIGMIQCREWNSPIFSLANQLAFSRAGCCSLVAAWHAAATTGQLFRANILEQMHAWCPKKNIYFLIPVSCLAVVSLWFEQAPKQNTPRTNPTGRIGSLFQIKQNIATKLISNFALGNPFEFYKNKNWKMRFQKLLEVLIILSIFAKNCMSKLASSNQFKFHNSKNCCWRVNDEAYQWGAESSDSRFSSYAQKNNEQIDLIQFLFIVLCCQKIDFLICLQ